MCCKIKKTAKLENKRFEKYYVNLWYIMVVDYIRLRGTVMADMDKLIEFLQKRFRVMLMN